MVSPAGAPPVPVQRSFQLWIATIVVGVIGVIVSLINPPQIPGAPAGTAAASSIVGLVIGVIFLALFVFFALRMRAGANWARLTLAILGGLSVLFTIIGLLTGASFIGTVTIILNIIQVILIVAAIVFSYQGAANGYFR